jgi:molybdate transport system ATP-binding protein
MDLAVKIQKQFGTFSLDADFSIQGDRVGIFGPSGCGKSTLVSLIAGLRHPDRGFINLDGETLFDSSHRIHVPPEHRGIGMVFQRPHLFPHLSVRSNLLYGYKRCDPGNRRIKLDMLVDILQIGHLLNRGIGNLSGGEKQRVAIGRAVLSNPRLLLMDEPLSAIDDSLKFQIISYLKDTCEVFNIPYIFISHTLLEMRIMTDQVLTVADGRVNELVSAEDLARGRMKESGGYTNLLRLAEPRLVGDVYAYRWGDRELFIADDGAPPVTLFELSSRDVILFKRHPEAISARNLLEAKVISAFDMGIRIGVELKCGSERLVAEITKKAAHQMEIREGSEIYAVIKALAFKPLR